MIFTFDDAHTLIQSSTTPLFRLITDMLCYFVVPTIPVMMILILQEQGKMSHARWLGWVLFALPVISIFYIGTLYTLAGWENSAHFVAAYDRMYGDANILQIFSQSVSDMPEGFRSSIYLKESKISIIYYLLILAGMVGLLAAINIICYKRKEPLGAWMRFLFKGDVISPFYAMANMCAYLIVWIGVRVIVGIDVYTQYPLLGAGYSIVLAILVYVTMYIGLACNTSSFSLNGILKPLFLEQNQGEYDTDNTVREFPLSSSVAHPDDGEPTDGEPTVYEMLINSLQTLMENEKLYLNPGITIEDVAAELCSNRVYVSRAVNQVMGSSFREYINSLRITYAKEYMLAHPTDTQEDTAAASGFNDATAFNKKFRQTEGCTPKEWIERGGISQSNN